SDLADACGLFFDAVQDGAVRHLGSPVLDAALRSARRRKLRSGEAWAWSRATSEADITPLVSVTLALWGVKSAKVPSRSEEHTSELQSRENLVCRLLLE